MHFPTFRQVALVSATATLGIVLSACSMLGIGTDSASTTTVTKTVTTTVQAPSTVDADAPIVDCNIDVDCTTPPVPPSDTVDQCVLMDTCFYNQDPGAPHDVFVCAMFSNSDGTISMMGPDHVDYFFPAGLTGYARSLGVQKWVTLTNTPASSMIADVVTATASDRSVTDEDIQSCG